MKLQTISKTLNLSEDDYFRIHMEIINPILPIKLSIKEIEIISVFMSFTGTLAEDRFSTTGRKIVREKLNLSHQSLSNYINNLTSKGFLIEKDNKLTLLPILFPNKTEQTYLIKIKLEDVNL
jgi:hypothetical protein